METISKIYRLYEGTVHVQAWTHGEWNLKPRCLPLPLGCGSLAETFIFAILLDWCENEIQAKTLTPLVLQLFPKKLGTSGLSNKAAWCITTAELETAVTMALVKAKENVSGRARIEYVAGQRRDHLRHSNRHFSGCGALSANKLRHGANKGRKLV